MVSSVRKSGVGEAISEQSEEYENPKNIILVGAKLDLIDRSGKRKNERQVTYREGLNLGRKLNLSGFIETSAKSYL